MTDSVRTTRIKPVPVWEAMSELNQRTLHGRVVVNPPSRMAKLNTHKTSEAWYFCQLCGRGFLRKEKWMEHNAEHKNEAKEQVSASSSRSTTGKKLQQTIVKPKIGKSKRPHKCKLCGAGFKVSSYLRNHIAKSHAPSHTFKCEHCCCRFKSQIGKTHHSSMYHNEKAFLTQNMSDDEGESGGSDEEEEHETIQQPSVVSVKEKKIKDVRRPHKCQMCGAGFTQSAHLRFHMRSSHTPSHAFQCKRCCCKLASKASYTRHFTMYHTKNAVLSQGKITKGIKQNLVKAATSQKQPVAKGHLKNSATQCGVCLKIFSGAYKLYMHSLSHGNVRPHKCELCFATFKTVAHLNYHTQSSHSPSNTFPCDLCCCKFQTRIGVIRHATMYHYQKAFLTQDGGAGTAKYNPKQYRPKSIIQTGKMKIKRPLGTIAVKSKKKISQGSVNSSTFNSCEVCHKVFSSSSKLYQHALTHSDERPYKCTMCGAGFKLSSYLRHHIKRSHSPHHKFQCPDCCCRFETLIGSQRHQNFYHGENAFLTQDFESESMVTKVQTSKTSPSVAEVKPVVFKTKHSRSPPKAKALVKLLFKLPSKTETKAAVVDHSDSAYVAEVDPLSMDIETDIFPVVPKEEPVDDPSDIGEEENFTATTTLQDQKKDNSSGVPSYECQLCGMVFVHKSSKWRHIRDTHSGNGAFKCSFCDCSYRSQAMLTVHLGKHHPEHREQLRNS